MPLPPPHAPHMPCPPLTKPAPCPGLCAGGCGAGEGAPAVCCGRGSLLHDLPGEHPPRRPCVELPVRLLCGHAPALHPGGVAAAQQRDSQPLLAVQAAALLTGTTFLFGWRAPPHACSPTPHVPQSWARRTLTTAAEKAGQPQPRFPGAPAAKHSACWACPKCRCTLGAAGRLLVAAATQCPPSWLPLICVRSPALPSPAFITTPAGPSTRRFLQATSAGAARRRRRHSTRGTRRTGGPLFPRKFGSRLQLEYWRGVLCTCLIVKKTCRPSAADHPAPSRAAAAASAVSARQPAAATPACCCATRVSPPPPELRKCLSGLASIGWAAGWPVVVFLSHTPCPLLPTLPCRPLPALPPRGQRQLFLRRHGD